MFGECHGHIFMNGRNYKEAADLHRSGVNRKDVEETLAAYRAAGITFFREGGDPFGVCAYAAEIAGDYGIDYRSPAFAIHKKGHYGGIVGLEYETLPEFAALVKRAAAQGADFIKIMFSGILDFNVYGKITGTGLSEEETRSWSISVMKRAFRSWFTSTAGRMFIMPLRVAWTAWSTAPILPTRSFP